MPALQGSMGPGQRLRACNTLSASACGGSAQQHQRGRGKAPEGAQEGPCKSLSRGAPEHRPAVPWGSGRQGDGAVSASSRPTPTAGLGNPEVLSSSGGYKGQVAHQQDQCQPWMCPSRGQVPRLTVRDTRPVVGTQTPLGKKASKARGPSGEVLQSKAALNSCKGRLKTENCVLQAQTENAHFHRPQPLTACRSLHERFHLGKVRMWKQGAKIWIKEVQMPGTKVLT